MNTDYDVIVVGGGTAGVPAAIAAARGGAKVLIIEKAGHLGGTAVYGIPFLGVISAAGEIVNRGIMDEIISRLKKEDGCFGYADGAFWNTPDTPLKYGFSLVPFDAEIYKYVAQEMVLESGADILFYTQLSDVKTEENLIEYIEVLNKSGKQKFKAKIYIDCSGDADLVYMAGGQFIKKETFQNSSILIHLGGVDLERFLCDLNEGKSVKGNGTWHTRVIRAYKKPDGEKSIVHLAGHFVFNNKETTFTAVSFRDGEIYLNASRTAGYDCANGKDLSIVETLERRNVINLIKNLNKYVPAFKDAVILNTSPVGVRETRNILGDYVLTKEDVLEGRTFSDGIAKGAYPIDIHDPKGGRTSFQFIRDGGSYSIPYRAFLPKNIDNVLVAGRCISANHEANGTTRIMGCVVSQGQAVGTAAALGVAEGVIPRAVDAGLIREKLKKDGAIV